MTSDSIIMNTNTQDNLKESSKRKSAELICFTLIVIMNLSAWIDLLGVIVEVPLMIPLTPEGWKLPAVLSFCMCAANIMPVIVMLMRWYQGKRFSEIPFIYIIITIGIVACGLLAMFWQRTIFLFGRERSVWLIGTVFALSMLDSTSSLVFFDYMKRFRSQYLTAAFLGEGLTGAIPTILLIIQGIGGEAICIESSNGTIAKPTFTEPRFSVTVFMFLITFIIIGSLIAFMLLQWTNIISLADAADPSRIEERQSKIISNIEETVPMTCAIESAQLSLSTKQTTDNKFILLLLINVFNSLMVFGLIPPLATYSLLPYGQKALFYSSLLSPLAFPIALLLSIQRPIIPFPMTIIGSTIGFALSIFIIIIATQSPCPWWADSIHGGVILVICHFSTIVIIAYIRITIGNLIKAQWSNEKGLFYFGGSIQIGLVIGTIPTYLLVNVFDVFHDRKACEIYCIQ